jgi:hypothetical protein
VELESWLVYRLLKQTKNDEILLSPTIGIIQDKWCPVRAGQALMQKAADMVQVNRDITEDLCTHIDPP